MTRVALGSAGLTLGAIATLAVDGPVWVFAGLSIASAMALWVGREGLDARTVLGLALLLRAAALPLPPTLTDDLYRYVWDGRRVMEAGARPWAERPNEHSAFDPELWSRLNSTGYPSVYPTVSQAVFAAGVWLGNGQTDASVQWIKAIVTLAETAGIALALRVLPVAWVSLYALHPLAVVEVAGMGHTEGLLIGALGLLAWASDRRWRTMAGLAVALAAGVKLWPLALAVPILRRGGRRAFGGLVVASAILAAPMLEPSSLAGLAESLALYGGTFDWYAPVYLGLKSVLWPVTGAGSGAWAAGALSVVWLALLGGLALTDDGSHWAFVRSVCGTVGGYVVLSAVLHPWHLLPLTATIPLLQFHWITSVSPLTYLVYRGLSPAIPTLVGWGGAAALGAWLSRRRFFDTLMRRRARAKWDRIASHVPSDVRRVLDLGGGEGFVADAASEASGALVTLADVFDYRRSPRRLVHLAGDRLPFPDGAFDATLLVYVLHHAEDPEALLREAVRVTHGPVVVLESVVRAPWTRRPFERLDHVVNRSRSGAVLGRPHWRSLEEWRDTALGLGFTIDLHDQRGTLHPTAVFVVRAEPGARTRVAAAPTSSTALPVP